ncbi:hypothetical protein L2744_09635 [Shewanella profunda]|uniref:hypothetical protein n=1 Tax=Shewanella profunda TaxID=254793 RepID=UPI00200FF015|nr:hypothetical protein [Shewanella profunda]MCL1089866.1 hypothetical protein [Shewanella profunda]
MQPITGFSLLAECKDGLEPDPLKMPLYFNGQQTHTFIAGLVIEGQYRCVLPNKTSGYLVITSFDCPFEESTEFSLLDDTFALVTKTSLAQLYDSFLLYAHWPMADNRLRLHYYGQFVLDLVITAGTSWLMPRPKLKLVEVVDPQNDPQTAASLVELAQRLGAIEKSL